MSIKDDFERWAEEYGLRHEPEFSELHEYDCKAAFEEGMQAARAGGEPMGLRHALQRVDPLSYNNFEDLLAEMVKQGITITHPPAKVPEGWKLVPIKPTKEMKAVCRAAGKTQVWADMIAAAPNPPQTEGE